jgi:hypothetical protein
VLKNKLPRGIINNNPGNIRVGDKWQGLASVEEMTAEQRKEQAFCVFKSPVWGIRAIARLLINYQDKHNLDNVEKIINRWAPNSENNTAAYVSSVVKHTGKFDVDVHKYEDLFSLTEAIIKHENGVQPYDKATIDKALVLAGVEPASQKNLAKESRTIKGAQVAGVATVGLPLLDMVQQVAIEVQGPLMQVEPFIPAVKWLLLGTILVGLGVVVYARYNDWKRGLR